MLVVYAIFFHGDLSIRRKLQSNVAGFKLFNKMPDIGSSQNVQQTQESAGGKNNTPNGLNSGMDPEVSGNYYLAKIFSASDGNYTEL